MAAAAILDNFEWPYPPQQLMIYLYSAHRAVIFAIAQLSCCAAHDTHERAKTVIFSFSRTCYNAIHANKTSSSIRDAEDEVHFLLIADADKIGTHRLAGIA